LFFNYTFYTFTPTFILPPQGGGVKIDRSFPQWGGSERRFNQSLNGEEVKEDLINPSRGRKYEI
jgi:hypothetical protein